MSVLTCDGLTKTISREETIHGLGFSLASGGLLDVRGGSSDARSWLLQCFAGMGKPSEGNILWEGNHIFQHKREYYSMLSYINHQPAIKPYKTVLDNIGFWSVLADSSELIPAAIAYWKLGDVVDTPYGQLPKAMQQRVVLARLVACYASIWVLDEPDVGLDEEGRRMLEVLIASRVMQGGVVVLAAHTPLSLDLKAISQLDLDDFIEER